MSWNKIIMKYPKIRIVCIQCAKKYLENDNNMKCAITENHKITCPCREFIKHKYLATFFEEDLGMPKRNTIINKDDILNLRISLNETKDVLDFIRRN